MYVASILKKTHQLELYETSNNFPSKFRESEEGQSFKQKLAGALFVKKGNLSPQFSATDYLGIPTSLDKLTGKFVLINFWATWCAPCIAEMPILRKIREDFPTEKLEIISVSYDTDSTKFINGIKTLQMNWKNIYSNNNLRILFGDTPIPAIYLIGPDGVIRFSSWEDEIKMLHKILQTQIK
ncbi:MAG: TlpA disulfide reductase family protein [Ferruginibacter sp.]